MATTELEATRLSPGLTCNDLQKSIEFYTAGLGFEITNKHEEGGVTSFVMVASGPASLGLGQDDFKKGKDRSKGVGMRIWINTDKDIKALAARAKAAGIKLDEDAAPLPWGPMAFAVTDPDGFKVTVANSR